MNAVFLGDANAHMRSVCTGSRLMRIAQCAISMPSNPIEAEVRHNMGK
jgi:hypothetical protein